MICLHAGRGPRTSLVRSRCKAPGGGAFFRTPRGGLRAGGLGVLAGQQPINSAYRFESRLNGRVRPVGEKLGELCSAAGGISAGAGFLAGPLGDLRAGERGESGLALGGASLGEDSRRLVEHARDIEPRAVEVGFAYIWADQNEISVLMGIGGRREG